MPVPTPRGAETTYLELEKKHNEAQEKLSKVNKEPFVYRFKALYISKNIKVTLIAFRLKNSKRVTFVYSTSSTIFAKTMRRHCLSRVLGLASGLENSNM